MTTDRTHSSDALASARAENEHLAAAVRDALRQDARLSGQPIDVRADAAGRVTLRGTVHSHRRRLSAVRIASGCGGVAHVDDQLEVDLRPRGADWRIAEDGGAALAAHGGIRPGTIAVAVSDGRVTLKGMVALPEEQTLAQDIALGIAGVRSVENRLLVDAAARQEDLQLRRRIEGSLDEALGERADGLRVNVAGGTAVVSGRVFRPDDQRRALDVVRRFRLRRVRCDVTYGAARRSA